MWFFSLLNALLGLGALSIMREDPWAGLLGAAYLFAGALYPHTRGVFPARLAQAGRVFSFLLVVSVSVFSFQVGPHVALVLGGATALVSLVWWPEIVEALFRKGS